MSLGAGLAIVGIWFSVGMCALAGLGDATIVVAIGATFATLIVAALGAD